MGTRIVVDGLWRCLCPSVDVPALLRAVNGSSYARPTTRRGAQPGTVKPAHLVHTLTRTPRPGCTAMPTGTAAVPLPSPAIRPRLSCRASTSSSSVPGTVQRVHNGAATRVGRLGLVSGTANSNASQRANGTGGTLEGDHQHQLAVLTLLRSRPPYRRELASATNTAIYAALRHLQDTPAAFNRINAFAQYLLEERKEPLTTALCEALVRSNCHVNGSADAVQDMLHALKASSIEGTPSLFHGALSVLAVHPDYLLRNAVLREMKERWIDLAPDGQQSVALGLLRDGQYERALNQLDEMTEAAATAGATPVPPWLLDIYVYVLGQEGFLDDALQIVNHRLLRDGDTVSLNIWSFLLDVCCRAGHFSGLTYVWNRVVRPGGNGLVTPSDAMALDVLNMAAQHGDADLAAAVMQMLAARGTKLSMPHFEAMLDCYAQAGAIDKALQALCIMNNAGIVPDQGSTRSIFLRLTAPAPSAPRSAKDVRDAQAAQAATMESAVAALFDLKRQYGSVPVAAFNVVLESMLESHRQYATATTAAVAKKGTQAHSTEGTAAEAGLDLYRHVRQLCPAGPNRATFRLLFRACDDPVHLNFLVREMRSFAFRPDMDMIDDVVYANATKGSLDQALQYVFDLIDEEAARRVQQTDATASDAGATGAVDEASIAAHAESLRRQPWISRRAAAALARRCIEEENERIWTVADASRDRGRPMDNILREAMGGVHRPTAAHNAYGVPHAVGADQEEPEPEEGTLAG
ncbi:hypothetical protein SPBR_06739 [Sporothrix brasiliensis 5110]|uniref:Uncharacterized protein n=1 Tax=Sporothrix brasiliensis 5110 TaxID=1398154 RepID=A0A0C2IQW6_9PEZI|nr:uncharacterized protein SPBR_06739 [Sporothrix brasiliensis 5110]KIH89280.1 hypothetical protein SPBR_06739 [Sporothrix brasiliensis 5110]